MADPVNCMVDDKKGKLSYDRTAPPVKDCKKDAFSFEIRDDGDKQVGVFQIKKGDEVIRENISKPFPRDSISKKSIDVESKICKVKVTKNSDLNLNDYFST